MWSVQKERKKKLTSSCLHCWSVFYSLDCLNADWLQHASLHASVELFCHPNLACACPWRHHERSLFTILIYRTYFELWPDLWIQTLKTTSAGAPAEDRFKPFHLISFPPPLPPPFLVSFIRSHPLLVERAEKKAGYSNLNQHWQRSRCKKGDGGGNESCKACTWRR